MRADGSGVEAAFDGSAYQIDKMPGVAVQPCIGCNRGPHSSTGNLLPFIVTVCQTKFDFFYDFLHSTPIKLHNSTICLFIVKIPTLFCLAF